MDVNIIGVAHTKFGKDPREIGDLMCDAYTHIINATDNIEGNSIDATYTSNFSSSFSKQCHLPAALGSYMNGGQNNRGRISLCFVTHEEFGDESINVFKPHF